MDGCAKVAADHVTSEQFRLAREARDVDAELRHELLALSMLSPMVYGRRLQLIDDEIPVFSALNLLSNVLARSARRPSPQDSDPDTGAGAVLIHFFGADDLLGLAPMTREQLTKMHQSCMEGSRGIAMRGFIVRVLFRSRPAWFFSGSVAGVLIVPVNARHNRCNSVETLRDYFRRLWAHHNGISGEILDCSTSSIGWRTTATVVGGFLTADGVMNGNMFFVAAESAKDAADGPVHL